MVSVDYVDENDKTIGSMDFEEVKRKNLIYREVVVMISNEKDELFLRKVGDGFGTSLKGSLVSGEVYEDAAIRFLDADYSEVKRVDLEFYSKDYITSGESSNRFIEIYKVKLNGPFKVDGQFASMKRIRRMVEAGEKFTEELKVILKNYYRIKV